LGAEFAGRGWNAALAAKTRLSMSTMIDPCVCPFCGRPNECELAAKGNHEGPCWCWKEQPDPEALRRIPEDLRRRVCLCRDCLTGKNPLPAETGPVAGKAI
jgi:hypothetical protein